MTDQQKMLRILGILSGLLEHPDTSLDSLNEQAKSQLGLGHSFMSAMQWLTGKKASATIDFLPESNGFFNKKGAWIAVAAANEFCREKNASAAARLDSDFLSKYFDA